MYCRYRTSENKSGTVKKCIRARHKPGLLGGTEVMMLQSTEGDKVRQKAAVRGAKLLRALEI